MMNAGTAPKLKKSANESICTPNSLVARSARATTPSARSRNVDHTTSHAAAVYAPSIASTTASMPSSIASDVTKFGAR
jgi:hypothetical protein